MITEISKQVTVHVGGKDFKGFKSVFDLRQALEEIVKVAPLTAAVVLDCYTGSPYEVRASWTEKIEPPKP